MGKSANGHDWGTLVNTLRRSCQATCLTAIIIGGAGTSRGQVIQDFEAAGEYPYGYAFVRPCEDFLGENLTVEKGAGEGGSFGAVFTQGRSRWYIEEEGVSTGPGTTFSVKVRFPSGIGQAWFGVGADAVTDSGLQVCNSGQGGIVASVSPGYRLTLSVLDNWGSASPDSHCPTGPCFAVYNDMPAVNPNSWYRLQIRWKTDGTARAEFLSDDGCETMLAVTPYTSVTANGAGYVIRGDTLDTIIMDNIAETDCPSPTIINQPDSQEACACEQVMFSVEACGDGPFTYQWYRNGDEMIGQTQQTLFLNPVEDEDFGDSFFVLVSNECGDTISNTAVLTPIESVEITQDPEDVIVCTQSGATFNVAATGGAPISYEWCGPGIDCPNNPAIGPSLDVGAPAEPGTYSYTCFVTNDCACGGGPCPSCASTSASLRWLDLRIIRQPQNTIAVADEPTALNLEAADVESYQGVEGYQWEYLLNGNWLTISDGGGITGSNTPNLQISSFSAFDVGSYRCHLRNRCDSQYSQVAKLQSPSNLYGILLGKNAAQINAEFDVQDVFDALLRFPGVRAQNLIRVTNHAQTTQAFNVIRSRIQEGDSFLFFYAGHGGVKEDNSEPSVPYSETARERLNRESNIGDEYLAINGLEWDQPSADFLLDDELTAEFLSLPLTASKILLTSSCFGGGFWGRQGNGDDQGDLDKVPVSGIISGAEESQVGGANGLTMRTFFATSLVAALNQIRTRQEAFSFRDLEETIIANYVNANFPSTMIIADNEPWLNTDVAVTVPTVPLFIFAEHTIDFDEHTLLGGCHAATLADLDGDGIGNVCDNCLNTANPTQEDCDHDGEGDACDVTFDDCQSDGQNDACQLDGSDEVTQSASLIDTGQVACAGTDCTGSNWWARCFALPTEAVVDGLTFGVSTSSNPPPGGSWQVEVNLYADNDAACPPGQPGTATLLRQVIMPISIAEIGQLVTANLSPPLVVEAGTALIAEVGTPVDGCSLGTFRFRTSANNGGQTAPSYLRSPDCGFTAWTDHASIGAPNAHTVIVLNTLVPGGNDSDGDGIPNECDLPDCDGDSIADAEEIADCAGDPACADCDENQIPDGCDIASCAGDPACTDCNSNLIPDGCETDCNSNSIPDACDLSEGNSEDCQSDDIPDDCQLSAPGQLTQSAILTQTSQLACSNTASNCTDANWWARCFPIASELVIEGIQFRVLEANGPPPTGVWQIEANLWRDNDNACPPSGPTSATLLGQTTIAVSTAQNNQLVTAVFDPPVIVLAGTALIAEIGTPLSGCSVGTGIRFRTGANTGGQTGPSFIRAPGCAFTNWTDYASIGFSNLRTVMVLETLIPGGNDQNNNQVPDECDVQIPPAPIAEPSGILRTRFISFTPGSISGNSAIRVNLAALHRVSPPYTGGLSVPFTAFEGQVRWVGPPTQYVESGVSGLPFVASQLQCAPHYRDWSTIPLLHVTGSAIVPSSVYEVENLAGACAGAETDCVAVSAPLTIATTRWGDVDAPYNPPSTTIQPDVADIGALVNKFRSAPGAPIKARALLAGEAGNPFGEITPTVLGVDLLFSHISACVDAFRGLPYPYTISSCP